MPSVEKPPMKPTELMLTCMPVSAHDKGGRRGRESTFEFWMWASRCTPAGLTLIRRGGNGAHHKVERSEKPFLFCRWGGGGSWHCKCPLAGPTSWHMLQIHIVCPCRIFGFIGGKDLMTVGQRLSWWIGHEGYETWGTWPCVTLALKENH